jgi:hypothetical protein
VLGYPTYLVSKVDATEAGESRRLKETAAMQTFAANPAES